MPYPPPSPPVRGAWGRAGRAGLGAIALLLAAAGRAAPLLPAAPAGIVEPGVPAFVVLGPEAIGLSSGPTDLHLLPDGRILVVAQQEIAFGDGVRWETFRGSAPAGGSVFARVAVDGDGRIYAGANGQIARIDLTPDARWQMVNATAVPVDETLPNAALVNVAVLPNMWYWYGGSGAILAWRPGQEPRIVGRVAAIDHISALGEQVFVSSQASGDLFQLGRNGSTVRISPEGTLANETVTCSAPFAPGRLIVGTNGSGLKLFDGNTFLPFRTHGPADSGRRINDVCPAGPGFFAAAVDTVGIVFFDREGHIVQVLDRTLDHRLARVQRLAYAPTGVLWALLNDAVARVDFPSPQSGFEPLVASGLAYARPLRHNGLLWLMADGRALRGVYDSGGRLERFEADMPPGRYLFTLTEVDGELFGANDAGIFVRADAGWRPVAPGIANARVGLASTPQGQLYVARNECGWIKRTPAGYEVRRIPQPGLGNSYNAITDPAGIVWLEMGTSRVGRIDPRRENPVVETFGTGDGLVDGWVQIFVFDGAARFNMANHLCRFDEHTRRFVEDRELVARFPEVTAWNGRPAVDSSGHFWFTANGAAHRMSLTPVGGRRPVETVAVGFETNEFTMEENGVVWMWGVQRLVRFDPRMPRPAAATPRAMITSVQFAASDRRLFAPGASLGRLPFIDNSLVIYFSAPADPFHAPVTFEVMLEGAVTQWVPNGNVGSAAFSRLKEGAYVFHVRPRAGDVAGAEATLAFTVQPPWFRTPLAWTLYVLGGLGLVVGAAWLSSFLGRREKTRLEQVVRERTGELNDINAQLGRQIAETTEKAGALAASEERYRSLNAELEERVAKRTAELSQRNTEVFQERRLLRTLIDNLPIAIYAKDTQCRKTLANPADLVNLGVKTEAEALGRADSDFFPAEDAAKFLADDQAVLTSGRTVLDREESFLDADGRKHWLLTSKLPLRDQSGVVTGLVGIGREITALKEAETKVEALHKQLLQASRTAGMAEVATGVLHNVGNVLNSVNVAAGVVAERLRDSRVSGVTKLARLLQEQNGNLARFLTEDERGRKVPAYLEQLAQNLEQERTELGRELDGLILNIDHIKEIVAMQQNYARVLGVVESVEVADLVEDAFKIHGGAYVRHGITVEKAYGQVPPISVDKHAVLQILVNLLHNAKYACDASNRPDKRVIVRIEPAGPDRVRISVGDNGVGIAPENLTRVFSQGFTTRKGGHGFGLHSGALSARQLGGSLIVHSEGEGRGATFTLELPRQPPASEAKQA